MAVQPGRGCCQRGSRSWSRAGGREVVEKDPACGADKPKLGRQHSTYTAHATK